MKNKRSRVRVYDNGGKTVDRYYLLIPSLDEPRMNDYYGASENPFYGTGFGQYAGAYPFQYSYKHLGKLVTIESLPEDTQKYFNQVIKDYEKVKAETKALTAPTTYPNPLHTYEIKEANGQSNIP